MQAYVINPNEILWKDFSLLHSIQTAPAAHSASYSMGTRDLSPGGKVAGA
jgi:hypothetical protein